MQIKCCADVAKRLLRASIYPLLLILLVSSFTLAITWHSLPYLDADSHWYVELAERGPVNVVKPFSNRILLPGIIHTLVAVCDLSTDQAFIFVAVIALILLATSVTLIMKSATPYPFVVPAVLCTPFLLSSFSNCYLPDLFHAALLGLFFFLVLRDELWQSLFVLFFLYLTRESTIVLTIAVVLASLYKSKRGLAIGAVVATGAGMAITSYVAGLGQPNIHGTSDLVYMLLKVPYNFCWNILGIRLWANTFGELMTRRPILEISLPNWLRFGSIHSVGIHSLSPIRPLHTITLLLTIFGIAPTILVYDLVRGWRQRLKDSHLWLLVAIIYGLVCYFMGTSIGSARSRLIGYGWPAFWLATPVLMVKYYHTDWRLSLRLLYLHVIVCWVPFVVGCFGVGPRLSIVSVTSCGVVLHYLAFRTMRRLHDADIVRSPSFVPAGKK